MRIALMRGRRDAGHERTGAGRSGTWLEAACIASHCTAAIPRRFPAAEVLPCKMPGMAQYGCPAFLAATQPVNSTVSASECRGHPVSAHRGDGLESVDAPVVGAGELAGGGQVIRRAPGKGLRHGGWVGKSLGGPFMKAAAWQPACRSRRHHRIPYSSNAITAMPTLDGRAACFSRVAGHLLGAGNPSALVLGSTARAARRQATAAAALMVMAETSEGIGSNGSLPKS